MDTCQRLSECLNSAQTVLNGAQKDGGKDNAPLRWAERQLASIVAQLQAMLLDLEAGLSFADMGFSFDADLVEMIEDMELQVLSLKGRIQSMRAMGR